ncbi:MAG TPA: hypothetical protein VGG53_10600 [Mycobacterium sp.]|jgi:hypothetical protein|uniref:hypothetical protein n=1 Tax=Mycobacterium sp. TaxID=1785 RepID=UPI002F41229A
MDVRQLMAAAAIASSTLTFGLGLGNAAPLDPPPPCPSCDPHAPPLKAMKCWPYGRVGPGSARGGGGVPVYPPPCPPGTPH